MRPECDEPRRLFPVSVQSATRIRTRKVSSDSVRAKSVVLVIDDEATVRQIAEDVLSRKGMRVLTADNGRSGVQMFREHSRIISLVLLDLQVPVMGGEDALALLHQVNPDVPVILSNSGEAKKELAIASRGAQVIQQFLGEGGEMIEIEAKLAELRAFILSVAAELEVSPH